MSIRVSLQYMLPTHYRNIPHSASQDFLCASMFSDSTTSVFELDTSLRRVIILTRPDTSQTDDVLRFRISKKSDAISTQPRKIMYIDGHTVDTFR